MRHATAAVAIGVAVAAAIFRVLTMSGFSNDHFVILTPAAQMLLGEWPVRDFVDPGMPLMYGMSAVAQLIGGRTLMAEAWLVAAAFGLSAGATIWIVHRWCSSPALGLWAACVQLAAFPRSYSYPKMLLYVGACGLFIEYARRRSALALFGLALLSVTALLVRHDHGLFISAASCVVVFLTGRELGVRRALRDTLVFAALLAVLTIPYLLYLQFNGRLITYVRSSLAFSSIEAARTRLEWPPTGMEFAWSPEALSGAGWFLLWMTPCVAFAVVWARRHTMSWSERGVVMGIATLAAFVNAAFLRDPLAIRLPDATVPAIFLLAWLARHAWMAGHDFSVTLGSVRAMTMAVLLMVAAAAAEIGGLGGQLERSSITAGPGAAYRRWVAVTDELRAPYAERQMPTDLAFALVPFYEYVAACTAETDRILIGGYAPEIPYYARRGFAGGHVHVIGTYYSSDADERLTIERLTRQSVPFVVTRPASTEDFSDVSSPLGGYVAAHYALMAEVDVDGQAEPARIYVREELRAAPLDPATGWPCVKAASARHVQDS